MSLLVKRTVIGIKQETTEGTPAVPGATDMLLAEDINKKPIAAMNDRNAQRATLSQMAHVVGSRHVELTFRSEVKASGAAGTAYAPLGAALQACGMTEAVVVSTSVTYAPTSAAASASYQGAGKTCTIEVYQDGLKQIIAGCRGNARVVVANAGAVAYYEFTFRGIYAAQTDASLPTTTFLSAAPPAVVSASFSQHAHSSVIDKFEFDMGNELTMRPSVNAATGVAGFLITARNPVGSCDPEATTVAGHDFFGKLISGAEASVTIAVGTAAGNITTITMPKAQYRDIAPGDRGGIFTFDLGLKFNMNSGDDEITIVQT